MPYETKPMKKQWLEVDGRMTPIILPQIWNHELQDWVVTSEQNPLPTQLYGSNVGERKVIERSIFDSRSDAVALVIPRGARRVGLHLSVHGVIGNLSDGDGAWLNIQPRTTSSGSSLNVGLIQSPTVNISGRGSIVNIGEGLLEGISNSGNVRLPRILNVNTVPANVLTVRLEIDGEFGSGEGIDCEVIAFYYQ